MDGLTMVYLPVNQAYMVMWFDVRLAGPMPKEQATSYMFELRNPVAV